MGWGARLLISFVLILIGAGAAVWGLGHYRPAARFLGIVPSPPAAAFAPKTANMSGAAPVASVPTSATNEGPRMAALEQRLSRVESATVRAQGSAGRADGLVVAFAARRAIDRGVALGYLENLLTDRFGSQHEAAVATIITSSREPIRLNDLIDNYETLGPDLRRGGPQDSWWTDFKRELGSVVELHRADRPAANADARYNRSLQRLETGDVDQALAETMRLPGAARAGAWTTNARRYIATHRALDEIESAALLPAGPGTR